MAATSLAEIHRTAEEMMTSARCASGAPLAQPMPDILRFALAASVTRLDADGMRTAADSALKHGATTAQLHEALFLISGLGVHSLMLGSPLLRQLENEPSDLSGERLELWQARIGQRPVWAGMERELPGFLRSLLHFTAAGFNAFLDYCAIPWRATELRPVDKELISLAADAMPSHAFAPGFRLHLSQALQLGATRNQIEAALAIAAEAG